MSSTVATCPKNRVWEQTLEIIKNNIQQKQPTHSDRLIPDACREIENGLAHFHTFGFGSRFRTHHLDLLNNVQDIWDHIPVFQTPKDDIIVVNSEGTKENQDIHKVMIDMKKLWIKTQLNFCYYGNCLCCERKQTSLKVNWFTSLIPSLAYRPLSWIELNCIFPVNQFRVVQPVWRGFQNGAKHL